MKLLTTSSAERKRGGSKGGRNGTPIGVPKRGGSVLLYSPQIELDGSQGRV